MSGLPDMYAQKPRAEGIHISCNMDTRDLPDMYALSPQAFGHSYISGKSQVPMLQLICNTFLASCARAKSSFESQQLYL